jgi:hypothetical protein
MNYHAYNAQKSMGQKEKGPAAESAIWSKLLSDNRKMIDMRQVGVKQEVALVAAWSMEFVYGNGLKYQFADPYSLKMLASGVSDALKQRAQERLSGKSNDELTALPNADSLSDERKAELQRGLETGKVEDLKDMLNDLKPADWAYLSDVSISNKLSVDFVRRQANLIKDVIYYGDNQKTRDALEHYKGKTVNRELVEYLRKLCTDEARVKKLPVVTLARRPGLQGVVLIAGDLPRLYPKERDVEVLARIRMTTPGQGFTVGSLYLGQVSAWARWSDLSKKKKNVEDPNQAQVSLKEEQDKFWDAVDKLCAGEFPFADAVVRFAARDKSESSVTGDE